MGIVNMASGCKHDEDSLVPLDDLCNILVHEDNDLEE